MASNLIVRTGTRTTAGRSSNPVTMDNAGVLIQENAGPPVTSSFDDAVEVVTFRDIVVEAGATLTIAPNVLRLVAQSIELGDGARIVQESPRLVVDVAGDIRGMGNNGGIWDLSGSAGTDGPRVSTVPKQPRTPPKGVSAGVASSATDGQKGGPGLPGVQGNDGTPGGPGATLILRAGALRQGVVFNAQGGKGGGGGTGGTGGLGGNGSDGGDGYLYHSGANGGAAANGGSGGAGGKCAGGGNGGSVALLSDTVEIDARAVNIFGGAPGAPGPGGVGGAPGTPGKGGIGGKISSNGSPGAKGAQGHTGPVSTFIAPPGEDGQFWIQRTDGTTLYTRQCALEIAADACATAAPNRAYLVGTSDFTFEMWILPSSPGRVATHASAPGTVGWTMEIADDKTISFAIGGVECRSRETDVLDGGWHHIAAVRSGAQLELLVDAKPVGSVPASAMPAVTSEGPLVFGACDGQTAAGGVIDSIRIWSVAREAWAIDQARYHWLSRSTAGLLGQWCFDGPSTEDISPTENRLVRSDGASFVPPFLEFVPEGQPFMVAKSQLMQDFAINDGSDVTSYRTILSLHNADGSAWQPRRDDNGKVIGNVTITPSSPVAFQAFGHPEYIVGPPAPNGAIVVAPDTSGEVSIVLTSGGSLVSPSLRVQADFMGSNESIVVSPDRQVHQALAALTPDSLQTVDAAKRQAVCDVVRQVMTPATNHTVLAMPVMRAASGGTSGLPNRAFYLPRDIPMPCSDPISGVLKASYLANQGSIMRALSPEFMEHPHWSFDTQTGQFTPLASDAVVLFAYHQAAADGTLQDTNWFQQFINGALTRVSVTVTTIIDQGKAVLHAAIGSLEKNFTVVIQTVEDGINLLTGILRKVVSDVGALFNSLLKAVRSLIPLDAFRAEQLQIRDQMNQGLDNLIGILTDSSFGQNLHQTASDLLQKTLGVELPADNQRTTAQDSSREGSSDPLSALIQSILQSPAATWLQNKLKELPFGNVFANLPAFPTPTRLIAALGEGLAEDVLTPIQELAQRPEGLTHVSAADLLGAMKTILQNVGATLTSANVFQAGALDLADVLQFVKQLVNVPLNLPFLQFVFGRTGITLGDLLAALVAMPVVIACEVANAMPSGASSGSRAGVGGKAAALAATSPVFGHAATIAVCEVLYLANSLYINMRFLVLRTTMSPAWLAVGAAYGLGVVAFGLSVLLPIIRWVTYLDLYARFHDDLPIVGSVLEERILDFMSFGGVLFALPVFVFSLWDHLASCGLTPIPPGRSFLGPLGSTAVSGLGLLYAIWMVATSSATAGQKTLIVLGSIGSLCAALSKFWKTTSGIMLIRSNPYLMAGLPLMMTVGSAGSTFCGYLRRQATA